MEDRMHREWQDLDPAWMPYLPSLSPKRKVRKTTRLHSLYRWGGQTDAKVQTVLEKWVFATPKSGCERPGPLKHFPMNRI